MSSERNYKIIVIGNPQRDKNSFIPNNLKRRYIKDYNGIEVTITSLHIYTSIGDIIFNFFQTKPNRIFRNILLGGHAVIIFTDDDTHKISWIDIITTYLPGVPILLIDEKFAKLSMNKVEKQHRNFVKSYLYLARKITCDKLLNFIVNVNQ